MCHIVVTFFPLESFSITSFTAKYAPIALYIQKIYHFLSTICLVCSLFLLIRDRTNNCCQFESRRMGKRIGAVVIMICTCATIRFRSEYLIFLFAVYFLVYLCTQVCSTQDNYFNYSIIDSLIQVRAVVWLIVSVMRSVFIWIGFVLTILFWRNLSEQVEEKL